MTSCAAESTRTLRGCACADVRPAGWSAVAAASVLVALLLSSSVSAWDRFEDLPGAARVRRAQGKINGFQRGLRTEVKFAPDGCAVAWREGDLWKQLPLPPSGEPTELTEAPEWPALVAPTSRFNEPPPAPRAPGRGRQALSATAPTGQRTAHYRDGNVFIKGPDGEVQVTTEGGDEIRFGNASWVYGEELDQSTAMWWSPDGRYLAYYRFDDRAVTPMPLLEDLTTIRPTLASEPYPKPGEQNPLAQLEIFDTESSRRIPVDVGPEKDQYIYNARWTPDSSALMFNRTNRHQNQLEVMLADAQSGASRVLLTETQETFQENHPPLEFVSDGQRFIWESERSGTRQFELWDLAKGRVLNLTNHSFPVQSVVLRDEDGDRLWYTAFGSETKINPQLFVVGHTGEGARRLTPKDRHYSNFTIAPDRKWFTAIEQFVDQPPALVLFEIDPASDAPAREVRVLRDPEEPWSERGLTAPEFFTCPAADGVTPLYGILYKPSNFDPTKRYPLLVDVYGGPGIQTVSTRMAAPDPRCEFGLMIARVDNRGTPGRGKVFEGATYLRLGGPDIDDQAAAAKFLGARPEIDETRIGITGHSYGGYATIMALLRYPEVFSVGVAGAAVTDWRQYDTIYAERYMRTPQENAEGYDAGSAVKLADQLRGQLLLIHGMIDDNVHATNLWAFVDVLQRSNRPVEMFLFPNARHGVGSPAAEGAKWSFLLQHLGLVTLAARDEP